MRCVPPLFTLVCTACASGVVTKDAASTNDTAIATDSPSASDTAAGDTGAGDTGIDGLPAGEPLPIAACTLTVERDNGPDGVTDFTSETAWLDRTDENGNVRVTDYSAWDATSGTSVTRSIRYDDQVCVVSDEQIVTRAEGTNGNRVTHTCNENGDWVDSATEVYAEGRWITVETVSRDHTYGDSGNLVETAFTTDYADPSTPDTSLRVEFTYDRDLLVFAEYFFIESVETQYYSVTYDWDAAGNFLGYTLVLGDYFEPNDGVPWASVEATYDANGNQLTYASRDSESRLDFTERTFDDLDRLLSTARVFDSDGTNDHSEATWADDAPRQLTNSYEDRRNSANDFTAVRTVDGDFPWLETITATATDGG
ncbi:MAG: hypothetical protein CL927_11680, partial [Deltaproteobacteria bacterium]|nr:hypothetical protein [Deltaproteobacteria bacterium]